MSAAIFYLYFLDIRSLFLTYMAAALLLIASMSLISSRYLLVYFFSWTYSSNSLKMSSFAFFGPVVIVPRLLKKEMGISKKVRKSKLDYERFLKKLFVGTKYHCCPNK